MKFRILITWSEETIPIIENDIINRRTCFIHHLRHVRHVLALNLGLPKFINISHTSAYRDVTIVIICNKVVNFDQINNMNYIDRNSTMEETRMSLMYEEKCK